MSMRVHNYTVYVSVSVCTCQWVMFEAVRVCVLYPVPRETGLLFKLDSVIGSSENPNEAMSISAAAPLPRAPVQPTGRPQPCLFKPDGERGEMGSEREKRWMNHKLFHLLWRWLQQNSGKYDLITAAGNCWVGLMEFQYAALIKPEFWF